MKSRKNLTPWIAALAIGAAVTFAPVAAADAPRTTTTATAAQTGTDPLVSYGTDPRSPERLGYMDVNQDEANTANGEIDVPF